MAKDKTSFILYSDLITVVKKLVERDRVDSTNNAGELFLHILEYVNDKDPVPVSFIIDMAFEPIKLSLKRDLKKYECYVEKQRVNGRKGGRPKETQKTQPFISKPKKADSVSVSDSDIIIKEKESLKVDTNKYPEQVFLDNWAKCREYYLKQPTHINKLNTMEAADLTRALKDFSKEEINTAMYGLFKQENIKFGSMLLRPKHFLEKIDVYYSAEKSKDYKLYGAKK